MLLIRSSKTQSGNTVLLAILISLLVPRLMSCGEGREPNGSAAPAAVLSESFTFFELGLNSRLDKKVRKELAGKLGRDAIEQRSILDLEINYDGFLKTYFPDMDALNRKLNFPPGERVEHNTLKLMYRYALRKDVPFDYVELVFSNFTRAPLLFRINFRVDEAGIVDTLESKYGQSQVFSWQEKSGQTLYWRKNGDFLFVSLVPDQFGNPTYQIAIYFVRNLEQLIAAEKKEAQKKSLKRTESGKTAF